MGDYRTTGVDYWQLPLADIRDPVLTGSGHGPMEAVVATYRQLADRLEAAGAGVRAALYMAQAAHEGPAGEASQLHIMELVTPGDTGAEQARQAAGALADQATFYVRARNDLAALPDPGFLDGPHAGVAKRMLAAEAADLYQTNSNFTLDNRFQAFLPPLATPVGLDPGVVSTASVAGFGGGAGTGGFGGTGTATAGGTGPSVPVSGGPGAVPAGSGSITDSGGAARPGATVGEGALGQGGSGSGPAGPGGGAPGQGSPGGSVVTSPSGGGGARPGGGGRLGPEDGILAGAPVRPTTEPVIGGTPSLSTGPPGSGGGYTWGGATRGSGGSPGTGWGGSGPGSAAGREGSAPGGALRRDGGGASGAGQRALAGPPAEGGRTGTSPRAGAGAGGYLPMAAGGAGAGGQGSGHRRPAWLVEDDPESIWLSGLPPHTDAVIVPYDSGDPV